MLPDATAINVRLNAGSLRHRVSGYAGGDQCSWRLLALERIASSRVNQKPPLECSWRLHTRHPEDTLHSPYALRELSNQSATSACLASTMPVSIDLQVSGHDSNDYINCAQFETRRDELTRDLTVNARGTWAITINGTGSEWTCRLTPSTMMDHQLIMVCLGSLKGTKTSAVCGLKENEYSRDGAGDWRPSHNLYQSAKDGTGNKDRTAVTKTMIDLSNDGVFTFYGSAEYALVRLRSFRSGSCLG